jgi:hypothetical protein
MVGRCFPRFNFCAKIFPCAPLRRIGSFGPSLSAPDLAFADRELLVRGTQRGPLSGFRGTIWA